MRPVVTLTLLIALTSCTACDGTTAPPAVPELPARMRLSAEASTITDNGQQITCFLDYIVEVRRDGDGYAGQWGGEAYRQSIDGTGAGITFWASAFTFARVSFESGGRVALVAHVDGRPAPPVTDSRFWDGVRRFDGELADGDVVAEGPWSCQPMDARDDDFGVAEGSWRLTLASPPSARPAPP